MLLKPLIKSIRVGTPLAQYPLTLFANGEQGIWLDPSDLSTLFQDAAGTTPVALDGDPVGLWLDKSGNGNHASQSISASRPTYRTDGILHWLEFDGVDDYLDISNKGLLKSASLACMIAGFNHISTGSAIEGIISFSNGVAAGQSRASIYASFNNGLLTSGGRRLDSDPFQSISYSTSLIGDNVACAAIYNWSAAEISVEVNSNPAISSAFQTQGITSPTDSISARIGSAGTGAYVNSRIYGVITVVNGDLSTVSTAKRYIARKSGVTL